TTRSLRSLKHVGLFPLFGSGARRALWRRQIKINSNSNSISNSNSNSNDNSPQPFPVREDSQKLRTCTIKAKMDTRTFTGITK
ncbi:MAG: hypothetical protein M3374_03995, partial [Pseudomonadota bacterium]|nr:hypothetical protein [Pseudomonadota bacterium]